MNIGDTVRVVRRLNKEYVVTTGKVIDITPWGTITVEQGTKVSYIEFGDVTNFSIIVYDPQPLPRNHGKIGVPGGKPIRP